MVKPSFVQVPPVPSGQQGSLLDTAEVTTTAGTVEREVVVLADPTSPTAYAGVTSTPPTGSEIALLVRVVSSLLPSGAATLAEQHGEGTLNPGGGAKTWW